jgi:dihydroxy-acid dehydratase
VAIGVLVVQVAPAELEPRRLEWTQTARPAPRGVLAKYAKLVKSANVGAICS